MVKSVSLYKNILIWISLPLSNTEMATEMLYNTSYIDQSMPAILIITKILLEQDD